MPSRNSTDLFFVLQDAYEYGKQAWKAKYKDLPQPFITCSYRPVKEQNELYAIGRTVKGKIVTNAKGGESAHNYLPSYAFDIAFITVDRELDWSPDLFLKFYEIIEERYKDEISWGGNWPRFKDRPHFEIKNWKSFLGTTVV